jgi:hypothetical protein
MTIVAQLCGKDKEVQGLGMVYSNASSPIGHSREEEAMV